MSAILAAARRYDEEVVAPSAKVTAYDALRLAPEHPSFVPQSHSVSDNELRTLADHAPLLIVVLGPNHERHNDNQVGREFLDDAYSQWRDSRPNAEQEFGGISALAKGLPSEAEVWLRTSDGKFRWISGGASTALNKAELVGRRRDAFPGAGDRTRVDEEPEHDSTARVTVGLDQARLKRVLDYIAKNIADYLSLDELASVACYSTFHFARKFTLAMGVSPQRYIGRLRLSNAMVELVAGKLSLAEIALDARFSSQASFTRAFHRETGTTPSEYKRQKQRETNNAQFVAGNS